MDKSLIGKGSSDPFVHFTVGDPLKDAVHSHTMTSPVKKKSLNPRWNWRCLLPIDLPIDVDKAMHEFAAHQVRVEFGNVIICQNRSDSSAKFQIHYIEVQNFTI